MSFNEQAASAFLDGKMGSVDQKKIDNFLDSKEPEKEPEKPKKSAFDEMLSGANRYAAGANDVLLNLLGLPGDVANFVLEKFGVEGRVYGSEAIRQGGAELGIGFAKGDEPDSALYKAGQYTGIGLEFLVPVLRFGRGAEAAVKASQTVEPAAGVTRGVAQRITAPFVTAPKTALTSELTGSAGAGIAAYYGEQEFGPTGEIIGGIIGGVPGSLVGAAIPKAWESVKTSLFPFTTPGAKIKAAARLQQLVETPRTEKTISAAQKKVLPQAKIPPAKLAGDKHLIALHNKVLDSDPVLAHKMRVEQEATNALARKELESLGGDVPIEETQAFLKGRTEHIKTLINARIDQALKSSKDALDNVAPKTQRRIVNTTVSKQIDQALAEARVVENEAWDKVRKTAISPTSSVRTAYQRILLERTETSDPAELPSFLGQFLGRLNKEGNLTGGKLKQTESVKNLHNLRSRIVTIVREEKGKEAPNWNKVRILNEVQESILDDLQSSATAKEFGDALEISRQLNQKFRGGIMDVILGHERTGGRVAPEISLESIRGGPKAATQINEVLAAAPESFGMMEELVKLNIQQSGIVDKSGRLIVSAAKKYMLKNEDTLDLFPDVKNALNQAIALEEKAINAGLSGKARLDLINKSITSRVAEAKPRRVLSTVMSDKHPQKKMRSIFKHSNDRAKRGIKNDIVDFLIGKSKTGQFDEHDMPILSGKKMANAWKTNKEVLKEGLDNGDIDRLNVIIETLKKNEDLKNLPEIGDVLSPENRIITYVARIAAARHGASMGGGSGGSIQTASMASTAAQRFIGKLDITKSQQLIKDAIQDPELFKALLSNPTKRLEMVRATKTLNSWMVAHTVSTLSDNRDQLAQ